VKGPLKQNAKYWIDRMERILTQNEKNALEYEQDLKTTYQKALQSMQTELEAFYQRYAKQNRITYTEARQRLSNSELKTFLQRQRTYLAEVEKFGNNKEYAAYLRQLSGRAYVTKLEEIQANLRYHIETLNVKYEAGLGNLLKTCYEDSFYKTLFDVQKNAGFGVSFTAPGSAQLDAAVREKWNGNNYSERIWANKDRLVATLNQLIPQEFVRGRSNQEIARDVAERMNVSYSNAIRLVRTEVNYISNKGTIKAYNESEVVLEFEYVATLDNRTSDICIDMDGKVFPLAQAQTGVNVPPLHPHCRSTTVPHFAEDDLSEPADRVARDKDGKTYLVGEDVTFKQWTDKYASAAYAKKAA
jgi:SPP1 gp7 family putative phage head morphogenesis protein